MSLRPLTRLKAIEVWFVAASVAAAAAIALRGVPAMSTGLLLLAMSLVPPALVLMLWPSANAPTMAETIHDAKTR